MFFFKRPQVTDRVQLIDAGFDYQNPVHLEIITKRIERFQLSLKNLQNKDQKILWGMAVGGSCWMGSYIFPLVSFAIGGFSYAAYHLGSRNDYAKEYRETLRDLIEAYKWSMGTRALDHWYKMGVPCIQDMILCLGPWVQKDTISCWNPDDLKSGKISRREKEPTEEFKIKLQEFDSNSQMKNIWFHLYGETATDDLFSFIKNYFKKEAEERIDKEFGERIKSLLKS